MTKRSAMAPDNQLQRTVIWRRGGTSAPFHHALAPRWTAQLAAAELERLERTVDDQPAYLYVELRSWFPGRAARRVKHALCIQRYALSSAVTVNVRQLTVCF